MSKMSTEEFDEGFDAGESGTSVLDLPGARRPGLAQPRVNAFFSWMIEKLDRAAKRLGVTRQSVIEVGIAGRFEPRGGSVVCLRVIACLSSPSSGGKRSIVARGRPRADRQRLSRGLPRMALMHSPAPSAFVGPITQRSRDDREPLPPAGR